MSKSLISLSALSALALSAGLLSGAAQASEDLAKAKLCVGCHQIDKKLLGPAYKDVAKKYAGVAGAEGDLAKKIRGGSKGVWGGAEMPANSAVSEAEAATLAKWILSLK